MIIPEGFRLDYEDYQKWLKLDDRPYLQVRAKEILPYMDLVLEMVESLEDVLQKDQSKTNWKKAYRVLEDFKEWKRFIERDPPPEGSIENLKRWLNK